MNRRSRQRNKKPPPKCLAHLNQLLVTILIQNCLTGSKLLSIALIILKNKAKNLLISLKPKGNFILSLILIYSYNQDLLSKYSKGEKRVFTKKVLNVLQWSFHFILTILWGRYYYNPHSLEKTEVNFSKLHSCSKRQFWLWSGIYYCYTPRWC